MIIHDGFYLQGFTRMDKGEEGAVFVRYEEEAGEKGAPEVFPQGQRHQGGKVGESFCIWLPAPKVRKITACAIVTRSSKNCYSATVYNKRRIATFKADSLDGLRKRVATFFGV